MSGSGSPTQSAAATTSSYEQKVILDLHSSPPALPVSLTTGPHREPAVPEVGDEVPDQHPLILSMSSPAKCTSAAPADPLTVPMVDSHHRIYSAGGLITEPFQHPTVPELPLSNPATRSLLEKQLEDTKAQVLHLDTKLKECNDICEKQKLHFRTAIVDLQTKLNDTIVGRNSVLELRRKEAESQEKLINQLQETFADVETSNQQQTQVLQDASLRVSSLHMELQACSAALAQAASLTVSHATKRGLTLVHRTTYSGPVDSEQVVGSLKEVLEHYEKELEGMRQKVGKAELGLMEAKEQFAARWKQNGEEQKQMLRSLREEHEKQLNAATERAQNARKQTLSLQSQLALTQEQAQKQLGGKADQITELQQRLEKLQEDAASDRKALQTKCDTLSSDLEILQQQYRASLEVKNQLHDQIQKLEQQLHDAKESAALAQANAETLQAKNCQLSNLEQESGIKLQDLQSQLERKTSECEGLGRLVEEVKQESTRQAEEKVLLIEESSKHRMVALTDDMTSKINDITLRCETLTADLRQREQELEDVTKCKEELTRTLAEVRQELQRVTEEKAGVMSDLEKWGEELVAIRRERESLVLLLEERNLELGTVQSARDQLQVQVNEKEEQCSRLQEQTSSMAHLAEVTKKASEDWKEERSQLKEILDRQTEELQDSKLLQENLKKKLKIREKRLQSLEEDKKRLQEEAQGTARESETVARSKEELKAELQEAKTQMDLMSVEGEKLKANLLEMEENHRRDVSRYKTKIQGLQRELQTVHKTIKATAAIDGKAVRVAESMQRQVTAKRSEIDMLQSEIHWLNECLDVLRKEKSALVVERDRYKVQVSELTKNNENLVKEQENENAKRLEQSSVVAKLEASLKKASKKHSECRTVIERLEQDIVRLKLKHQLEIKELQRAVTRPSPSASIPSKLSPRKSPPQQTTRSTNRATIAVVMNQNRRKLNTETSVRDYKLSNKTKADSTKGSASNETRTKVVTTKLHSSPTNLQKDLPQSVGHSTAIVPTATVERDKLTSQIKETRTSSGPKKELSKLLTDEELRSLLLEMYGIVSGQPNIPRTANRSTKESSPTNSSASPTCPVINKSTLQEPKETNTKESGYSTTPMTRQGKPGMTAPLLTSSPVKEDREPKTEDLSLLSSVPAARDSPRTTPEPDFLLRPRSPVASLLGVSPHMLEDVHSNIFHNNSHQSGSHRVTVFDTPERNRTPDLSPDFDKAGSTFHGDLGSSLISEEGVDLRIQNERLKRLQDKLQGLSKMGGHLQKENKDIAVMIRRQDTRLRKCRQQEQSIKQLAKKD
ncbi:coiled-coil domain-containing protein 158-like isoform X2 [Acanthaster planci]|uniref:Coiled-coil domain-containing protein 158-like isoform X2 n=1 Tax=Acanthaster planci TaxID=133434 RepID=A0A8B7XFQ1_ACAPL|nr:coiled-coil domain-containing protein 158-like isoform X2 [Acanthaster planci]